MECLTREAGVGQGLFQPSGSSSAWGTPFPPRLAFPRGLLGAANSEPKPAEIKTDVDDFLLVHRDLFQLFLPK